MSKWEERVALVTGGRRSIKKATAIAFAANGARVIVSDVQTNGGEETVAAIRAKGGDARFVRADVSRATDVAALVQGTTKAYGRLDFAFNNAGIEGVMASTDDCTEENFDRTIAVNLKSVWL